MQKLTHVESERLMAVMSDLLDRLNYLTYVPTSYSDSLSSILQSNRCQSTADLLHRVWEADKVCFSSPENGYETNQTEGLDHVVSSARSLCRNLRENPVAVELLFQHGTTPADRSNDLVCLIKSLLELTDLTHMQLEKTVEDARSKTELLGVAESRMKQAEDDRVGIRSKLLELRRTKDEENALLESQVQKLSTDLRLVQQATGKELGMIDSELREALNKAHEMHTEEMKLLSDKQTALEAQNVKMSQEHREQEDLLRKKKCKMAAEVSVMVAKYDEEMKTMGGEVAELEQALAADKAKCDELSAHFVKIDEEQARIDAEERVLEEMREREREKRQFVHNAAIRIQKIYRGLVARREYAKLVAKSKKGKKKGGKKKK